MTTAYVATLGGHISELVDLASRIPDEGDQIWITNDSPQTRDLLANRPVATVPFIGERDRRGVLRALPEARKLFGRYHVETVVSTGSAIALAYLPAAATMGLDAHYIESTTRVEAPSMTGRVLSMTPGVRCWWQFENPPRRFRYLGGVYDRYKATERSSTPPIEKVVVTVGTTDRDFRRLIARLVAIIPEDADVLWQTGHSNVAGLDIDAKPLIPEKRLVAAIDAADVVVSHAGAGSLALALRAGKVPVFVPRRAAFDEQLDDHQVELARWAFAQGLAITAEADRVTVCDLDAAARRAVTSEPVRELRLT